MAPEQRPRRSPGVEERALSRISPGDVHDARGHEAVQPVERGPPYKRGEALIIRLPLRPPVQRGGAPGGVAARHVQPVPRHTPRFGHSRSVHRRRGDAPGGTIDRALRAFRFA